MPTDYFCMFSILIYSLLMLTFNELNAIYIHRRTVTFCIGSIILNIPEQWPRSQETTNGACHWSSVLNLRHGEEKPIYINTNHVCFSLIDPQLKKSIIVLLCLSSERKCLLIFCGTVCKQVHENIMASGDGLDSLFYTAK